MSDALEKAEQAAREAAQNTASIEQIVATVMATQQAMQQQPAPAPPARSEFDSKKWLTIGFLAMAGGLVASLFVVAVAIGAVSVAILALVLRAMWRDFQKGH